MGFDGFDVLSAIQTWWQQTPAAQALSATGELWFKEAPENANQLPYATFFLVSDVVELQTTAFAQKRSAIQFNFHHSTDAGARQLAVTFRMIVRKIPLTINGSSVMHVLPNGDGLDEGEGLGPGGQDCWVAFQTIDCPYTEV